MKKLTLLMLMMSTTLILADDTEEIKKRAQDMMANMNMSEHTSKILNVFSASKEDAVYVAYLVEWNDRKIVVTDMFCETPKKVGDTIRFFSQSLALPMPGKAGIRNKKVLQFIVMPEIDYNKILEKHQK